MSIDARNRSIPDWFTRIRTRQTVLPRFQRFEAWGHSNVAQLFNTILQGLPVGALLVLEVGDQEPFISRPIIGAPTTGDRITEHLLDGQQRLTALWRGLYDNYEDRSYFLYLKEDEETGMPYYVDSLARWQKDGDSQWRPLWANQPREQWARRMIPLDFFLFDEATPRRFRGWANEAIDNQDERDRVVDEVSSIRTRLAAFNLPYLSLPVTTKTETALDVFIKMNTSAAPLSTYDVVVAQLEAGMGKSLHDLVAATRERNPTLEDYYAPENLALYASALLQERAPINSTYMARDFGRQLLDNWNVLLRGVSRAVDFLEEERIFDSPRLPTEVVVPVLVALWGIAPEGLDGEGRARTILRQFLWRACFSARYEKATNSRSLVDFMELKQLLSGSGEAKPAVLDDVVFPLPEPQELTSAGWPKKKERLARGILALALREGGLDLADGSTVSRSNLARREYHHLFPEAYLRRQELPDRRIYLSLNCALVAWRTNRSIADKEPERYLAERRDGTVLGENEVRARLASHLIPFDEMVAGDYDAFLSVRSRLIHAAMTRLCRGSSSS